MKNKLNFALVVLAILFIFAASAMAATYEAQCISNTLPSTMAPGETKAVQVTMKNLGQYNWEYSTSYKYSLVPDSSNSQNSLWSVTSVQIPTGVKIPPGAQYTFAFNIKAPSTPGTYSSRFKMNREGVGQFISNCGRDIVVQAACTNDCSPSGIKQCSSATQYRTCGQYDSDSCLEWGSASSCASGQTCSNGNCVSGCVPATETCNGLDDDCDGLVDDGLTCSSNPCVNGGYTACTDVWGGYGKEGSFRYQVSGADCVQPSGGARFFCNTNKFYSCDPDETWTQIGMITAANNQVIGNKKCVFSSATFGSWVEVVITPPPCLKDCDDTSSYIKPGAIEVCNSKDDDCDGVVDDNCLPYGSCVDADGDGVCSAIAGIEDVPSLGNVLKMHLEEAPGQQILDSSSSKNNGSRVGIVDSTGGAIGGAYYFNGSDTSIEYINIPHSASISPSSRITLAAWVKPSGLSAFGNGIFWKCIKNGPYNAYYCWGASYSLEIGYQYISFKGKFTDSTSFNVEVRNNEEIPELKIGEWQHIAATYDGTNVNLYYNGVLKKSASYPGKTLYYSADNEPLKIGGGDNYEHKASFTGIIDEALIYNRALTSQEILDIYKVTKRDCDDNDNSIHLNAPELCGDRIDQNCNGEIDDRCSEVCSLGYVRCAWNTGYWDTKYNQPERCGVYPNGSITWVDEGPNCDLSNEICYAATIEPSPGISFEKGIGKTGCRDATMIDPDGRKVYNKFGVITFPEGLNLDDTNIYDECVKIYEGYFDVDRTLCPNLRMPIDVEWYIPIKNDEYDLSNFKIKHDSDGDRIFESEYDNYTVEVIDNYTLVHLTAPENQKGGAGGGSRTKCGGSSGVTCEGTCIRPMSNPLDELKSNCLPKEECSNQLKTCLSQTTRTCFTKGDKEYAGKYQECDDELSAVFGTKCKACCMAPVGKPCKFGCANGVCKPDPNDTPPPTNCDNVAPNECCGIVATNQYVYIVKDCTSPSKTKCGIRTDLKQTINQIGKAVRSSCYCPKDDYGEPGKCKTPPRKCPQGQTNQQSTCCVDSTGVDKCPCCDANGQPYGILCRSPNCGGIDYRIIGCGTSCPSACFGGYFYGGGSQRC